jgi:hypothetical protein
LPINSSRTVKFEASVFDGAGDLAGRDSSAWIRSAHFCASKWRRNDVRKSEFLRRYAVKLVAIERIKPSPENEEIYGPIDFHTDPALQSTIDSIERRGLEEPIILTVDYYILSGHRRFVAVQHLGWKKVPVRFSKIRRDESTDYHRLLTEYNPQRIKSAASLLSERF